jgi:hypothetical protein
VPVPRARPGESRGIRSSSNDCPRYRLDRPPELLGTWLGLTQAQVSRIENGPPVRNLDTLAHWELHEELGLDIQVGDLLCVDWGGGGLNIIFGAGRELRPWRTVPVVQDVCDRLLTLMTA